jgi:phosphatidylserine/phosphatidylglycerophosphate/cardiolipin synthase-like enzyme
MSADFEVEGINEAAPFTLKVHRGEGMALLAMNWKEGRPPADFVGFAIQYREPGGDRFYVLQNRLGFTPAETTDDPRWLPTTLAPIQKFRWAHFPRNAELDGDFVYQVIPVFMNEHDELSYGEQQEVALELRRDTYPGRLNIGFTRGFVSSQAFVDRYQSAGPISTLLPATAKDGLVFEPTHPKAADAYTWMGFEARRAILQVLDDAIADPQASVRVIAYDLNEPEIVSRLEKLEKRVKVIIDDSGSAGDSSSHRFPESAENEAERRLLVTAGTDGVKRQHVGKLQHNKTVIVDGPQLQVVVWGSTNLSWRGFFVQANNAVVVYGEIAVALALAAFEDYWQHENDADGFAATPAARLAGIGFSDIDAEVAFSPHGADTALLGVIARDISENTASSLFYSLAFLYQTEGPVRDAIEKVTADDAVFVYGMSDRPVDGLDLQRPNGNPAAVSPAALNDNVPAPFRVEPGGGGGIRLHHKFVVIDFDQPTARVYTGSYNFSDPADTANGENLLVIRDRRIAVAYTVEALRLFDHYHFRVAQREAKQGKRRLALAPPPRKPNEKPWWDDDYTDARKIRDRELFS